MRTKQKIFTFFAALLFAGSMSAVTINLNHAIVYMTEREGLSLWEFALYGTQTNDYPGLGIGTYRTNDSIAGTQTVVNEFYVTYFISADDYIMPSQYSKLVVTRIRSGLYHFSFTFTGHHENYSSPDEEYVVDAEVPTEIRNLAGEIIEEAYVPEGIEDIHANSDKPVKVLNDGHLYILRSNHIFDIQGKMVR